MKEIIKWIINLFKKTESTEKKDFNLSVSSATISFKSIEKRIDYDFYPLESLHIKNFYGIKALEVEFPRNAPWIFLTGENGYGKTNILQAVARGLSNSNDNKQYEAIKPLQKDSSIMVKVNGAKLTVGGKGEESDKLDLRKDKFRVMGYGSARTSMGSDRNTKIYAPASGLFESGTLLRNIETEGLSRWKFIEIHQKKYDDTIKKFKQLMPNLLDVEIDENSNVWYIERDDNNKPLPKVRFDGLGSGYKNLISMVGDIIISLNEPRKNHEEISLKTEVKGFVLIDEFELYLHPKMQKNLPIILSSLFPDIQFIVSTHSPIPLLGAPEGSVFLNVTRTHEDGIQVERLNELEKEIKDLLPNSILSSPLFGFTEIFPLQHNEREKIRTETSYEQIKYRDKIRKELQDREGTETDEFLKNFIRKKANEKK